MLCIIVHQRPPDTEENPSWGSQFVAGIKRTNRIKLKNFKIEVRNILKSRTTK